MFVANEQQDNIVCLNEVYSKGMLKCDDVFFVVQHKSWKKIRLVCG